MRTFGSGAATVRALGGVSFEIAPSQLTILRGRSGSGKTTLINIMGTLDYPTSGEVFLEDQNITRLSEGKRDALRRTKIGFIFQSVALMSLMTAYENVEYGLRIAGMKPSQRAIRAKECLELVGLTKRMHHVPSEMSGGEQQRVAIARAIAARPSIIFADEPTSELDTGTGLQVVKLFKELIASEGLTIVMTTHDPGMIDIADNVITLQDGEIING